MPYLRRRAVRSVSAGPVLAQRVCCAALRAAAPVLELNGGAHPHERRHVGGHGQRARGAAAQRFVRCVGEQLRELLGLRQRLLRLQRRGSGEAVRRARRRDGVGRAQRGARQRGQRPARGVAAPRRLHAYGALARPPRLRRGRAGRQVHRGASEAGGVRRAQGRSARGGHGFGKVKTRLVQCSHACAPRASSAPAHRCAMCSLARSTARNAARHAA